MWFEWETRTNEVERRAIGKRTTSRNEKPTTMAQEKNDAISSKVQKKKRVYFGTLEIKKHGIILGDNPAVTYGPPITSELEAFESRVYPNIDEYENHRPRRKVTYYNPRRHRGPTWIMLLTSQVQREKWLTAAGYSKKDMKAARREVERIQHQRFVSYKWYFHPFRTLFEIPQTVSREVRLTQIQRNRQRVIKEYKLQQQQKQQQRPPMRRMKSSRQHSAHSIG